VIPLLASYPAKSLKERITGSKRSGFIPATIANESTGIGLLSKARGGLLLTN